MRQKNKNSNWRPPQKKKEKIPRDLNLKKKKTTPSAMYTRRRRRRMYLKQNPFLYSRYNRRECQKEIIGNQV